MVAEAAAPKGKQSATRAAKARREEMLRHAKTSGEKSGDQEKEKTQAPTQEIGTSVPSH